MKLVSCESDALDKYYMELKTDLIQLLPDDQPDNFFKKLRLLPENHVSTTLQRFEKYARYSKMLQFHLAALRRPSLHVWLTFNDRFGWHTSSCIRSLRDEERFINRDKCTCEEDLANPNEFFDRVVKEILIRCKICKRFIPEWEEVAAMKNPRKSEPMASPKTEP